MAVEIAVLGSQRGLVLSCAKNLHVKIRKNVKSTGPQLQLQARLCNHKESSKTNKSNLKPWKTRKSTQRKPDSKKIRNGNKTKLILHPCFLTSCPPSDPQSWSLVHACYVPGKHLAIYKKPGERGNHWPQSLDPFWTPVLQGPWEAENLF